MAQYDSIAEGYQGCINAQDARACVLIPTIKDIVGDISGKKIIDLACGEGFWSRLLKDWGAETVTGFDNSQKMIDLALEQEKNEPKGITYQVANLDKKTDLPSADLVFAGYLFHYAETEEALLNMCSNVARSLPSGGRLVGLVNNPDIPLHELTKYKRKVEKLEDLRDGSRLKVTMYRDDGTDTSFEIRYWSRETYERLFKEAGFASVNWMNLKLGNLDNTGFDEEFWQDYLEENEPRPLECVKA